MGGWHSGTSSCSNGFTRNHATTVQFSLLKFNVRVLQRSSSSFLPGLFIAGTFLRFFPPRRYAANRIWSHLRAKRLSSRKKWAPISTDGGTKKPLRDRVDGQESISADGSMSFGRHNTQLDNEQSLVEPNFSTLVCPFSGPDTS